MPIVSMTLGDSRWPWASEPEPPIWRPVLAVGMAVHGAPNTVICALPPPCLDGFSSAGCRAGDVV
jgi:hypothetical protein